MSDQYTRYPPMSVYLMHMIEPDYYKIGISRDVKMRLGVIQTSTPFEVVLIRSAVLQNAKSVEEGIHAALAEYHVRGEWFACPYDVISRVFDEHTQTAVPDLHPPTQAKKGRNAPTKKVHWMRQLPENAHRVTPEMVAEARNLADNYGLFQGQIAERLGIARKTVNDIIRRKGRFSA